MSKHRKHHSMDILDIKIDKCNDLLDNYFVRNHLNKNCVLSNIENEDTYH